jgi:hypothetical protein
MGGEEIIRRGEVKKEGYNEWGGIRVGERRECNGWKVESSLLREVKSRGSCGRIIKGDE